MYIGGSRTEYVGFAIGKNADRDSQQLAPLVDDNEVVVAKKETRRQRIISDEVYNNAHTP